MKTIIIKAQIIVCFKTGVAQKAEIRAQMIRVQRLICTRNLALIIIVCAQIDTNNNMKRIFAPKIQK